MQGKNAKLPGPHQVVFGGIVEQRFFNAAVFVPRLVVTVETGRRQHDGAGSRLLADCAWFAVGAEGLNGSREYSGGCQEAPPFLPVAQQTSDSAAIVARA